MVFQEWTILPLMMRYSCKEATSKWRDTLVITDNVDNVDPCMCDILW